MILTPGTHTVELDGVVQRYHVHGTGPVCVAHSGGPGILWDYLRMPAVEEHLTVVYVEPIGTGGSSRLATHPDGYTRDRYVRAVLALLDHLGLEKPLFLGHSHGGFVAQRLALTHPGRISGIVLYDSAPVVGPEHGAELARQLQEYVRRCEGDPGLPAVLAAFESLGSLRRMRTSPVPSGASCPRTSRTSAAASPSSARSSTRSAASTSRATPPPASRNSSTTARCWPPSPCRPSSSSAATTSSAVSTGSRPCTTASPARGW
ncbi:alpha/beta fold hydrolase [Amycolatopsis sp. FDAARGOS 1241]|uniref:alpha/beta fold hydrolase n=1 Tax=Amycolatopsis sp. FDAARGOS 1241 TaxID=2778070 RepID=UPI001EF27EC2|nr:alpha/beta hydrolase [Amycolatopsis sp. FDAARGOS 1241]